MRSDLSDAVAAARARYPGAPVYALGESMGGAVVLTALASANPPAVDGVILVAPAASVIKLANCPPVALSATVSVRPRSRRSAPTTAGKLSDSPP